MKTRLATDTDYAFAVEWWQAHNHPQVPRDLLPKCGVVVEDDGGRPVAMGWLNLDNSVGVGMLNFIVTNPLNSPAKFSVQAIKTLAEAARQVAAELGYGVLIVTASETLAGLLRRQGFAHISDQPHYHVFKRTR